MKALCIIPARGGSKGVKNKNLLKIAKYSLVERALFVAMGCSLINKIIVSSDSSEIIRLVNQYGDYAPFTRPRELSTDEANSLGVMQHALHWAENKDKLKYDYIVLLEPTCPFRLPIHIKEALQIAANIDCTSVMSVVAVGDYHPVRIKKMDDDGALKGYVADEPEGLRRQDQEPAFIRNCAVNTFARSTLLSGKLWGDSPYGYLMDRSLYGINIDEGIDVLTAIAFYHEMEKNKACLEKIEHIPQSIRGN